MHAEKDYYKAFENKHRGSRELIKSRLGVYLPFVKKMQAIDPELKVLDLGCGRGEWLEILHEMGIKGQGVDSNAGMLEGCEIQNLSFINQDIFKYLETIPDESYSIVSCFHLVEHLPFQLLQKLIQEVHRVLKSGGLLIMETPNPENLVVGTNNFYMDPTHQRPLPPELLAFLPEYYGYKKVKILRLNESHCLPSADEIKLIDVIAGSSPDYAVIAQKDGSFEYLNALITEFEKEHGVTLQTLTKYYDEKIAKIALISNTNNYRLNRLEVELYTQKKCIELIEKHIDSDELTWLDVKLDKQTVGTKPVEEYVTRQSDLNKKNFRAERAEAQVVLERKRYDQARHDIDMLTQKAGNLEDRIQKNEENYKIVIQELQSKIHNICNSKSWRITLPLRFLMYLLYKFKDIFNKFNIKGQIQTAQNIDNNSLNSQEISKLPEINECLTGRARDMYENFIAMSNQQKKKDLCE